MSDPHGNDIEVHGAGAAQRSRRLFVPRSLWHSAGLLLALVMLWLVFRAYTHPEVMIDLANFRLC